MTKDDASLFGPPMGGKCAGDGECDPTACRVGERGNDRWGIDSCDQGRSYPRKKEENGPNKKDLAFFKGSSSGSHQKSRNRDDPESVRDDKLEPEEGSQNVECQL